MKSYADYRGKEKRKEERRQDFDDREKKKKDVQRDQRKRHQNHRGRVLPSYGLISLFQHKIIFRYSETPMYSIYNGVLSM